MQTIIINIITDVAQVEDNSLQTSPVTCSCCLMLIASERIILVLVKHMGTSDTEVTALHTTTSEGIGLRQIET